MADLILTRNRTPRKKTLGKNAVSPPELFEPWFRSKKKSDEISRTQTTHELRLKRLLPGGHKGSEVVNSKTRRQFQCQ